MEENKRYTIEVTDNISGEKMRYATDVALLTFLAEQNEVKGFLVAMYDMKKHYLDAVIDSLIAVTEQEDVEDVQKGNRKLLEDVLRAANSEPCDNPDCITCQAKRMFREFISKNDEENEVDDLTEPTEL